MDDEDVVTKRKTVYAVPYSRQLVLFHVMHFVVWISEQHGCSI